MEADFSQSPAKRSRPMTTTAILASLASFGAGYAACAAINCRSLHAKLDTAKRDTNVVWAALHDACADVSRLERDVIALKEELRASTDARAQTMLKKQVRELAAQLSDAKAQLAAARTAFS